MSQRVLAESPPAPMLQTGDVTLPGSLHAPARLPIFPSGFTFWLFGSAWSPSSTRAGITLLREKGRKFSPPQGLPALFLKKRPAGPQRPETCVPSALQKGALERDRSSLQGTRG